MALDAASAISTILENAGYTTYFALPDGFTEDPVIWIQNVGGARQGFRAMDRVQVAVISSGRQKAAKLADEVLDMLADRHHFVPGHGLIDHVQVESTPVEVPYRDNRINFIFNLAAHSRLS